MKKILLVLSILGLFLLGGPRSWADTSDYPSSIVLSDTPQPAEIELGYSNDTLSNGFANWQEYYVSGLKQFGDGASIYGVARDTTRFGLTDQEVSLGGSTRLSKGLTLQLDGSVSPTHHVLPQYGVGAELYHSLGGGFGIFGGETYRRYNLTQVNIQNLGLEYYFSNYRLAYTFRLAEVGNASPTGNASSLEFDSYYGKRNKIGIIIADGSEAENIGNNIVLVSTVRSAAITGLHWVDQAATWGITYTIGVLDQNPFYTRTTFQVGVRHSF